MYIKLFLIYIKSKMDIFLWYTFFNEQYSLTNNAKIRSLPKIFMLFGIIIASLFASCLTYRMIFILLFFIFWYYKTKNRSPRLFISFLDMYVNDCLTVGLRALKFLSKDSVIIIFILFFLLFFYLFYGRIFVQCYIEIVILLIFEICVYLLLQNFTILK